MRHHYTFNNNCQLIHYNNSNAIRLMFFVLTWIYFWTDGAKLVVTAMSVSSWFFNQERKVGHHAFRGFKTVFSTSFGTIAFGAVISSITHALSKVANRRCWFFDPIGVVMKLLWCCFKSVIETFGKYSLIAHSMTVQKALLIYICIPYNAVT